MMMVQDHVMMTVVILRGTRSRDVDDECDDVGIRSREDNDCDDDGTRSRDDNDCDDVGARSRDDDDYHDGTGSLDEDVCDAAGVYPLLCIHFTGMVRLKSFLPFLSVESTLCSSISFQKGGAK